MIRAVPYMPEAEDKRNLGGRLGYYTDVRCDKSTCRRVNFLTYYNGKLLCEIHLRSSIEHPLTSRSFAYPLVADPIS